MTAPRHPKPGHEVYEELAAGWILHSLEPAEESRFQDHLSACPDCQAAVADYAAALAEVSFAGSAAEPPPRLAQRIHDEVARDLTASIARPAPAPSAVRSIADRRPDRRHRYRWLAAAAAGLVVALGVGDLVLYQQRGEVRQELASQRAAADQARKAADARSTVIRMMARPDVKVATLTNSAGQGQGMVMIEPNGAVHLVSDGLSRNKPTVTTYVLWRVVNGSPKAVSTFDVAGPAIALHDPWQLPRDDSFASSFAVSLEPGRQMPAKPTDVVASGSVRG